MRPITISTIRWMTVTIMMIIAAACTSTGSSSPTTARGAVTTTPAAASTDPAPTSIQIPAPAETPETTATSAETGETGPTAPPCPVGEYPAVGAFDLATGAISWSTCSPEEAYRSIVGATPEVVLFTEYAGPNSNYTIALDAADGTERWRRSTPPGPSTIPRGPVDGHGTVVLVTDDQGPLALVGVDVLTGDEKWRVDGVTAIGQTTDVVVVSDAPGPISGPPGPPSGIRGIDRATGGELWSSDIVLNDMSGVGVERGAAAVWENTIAVPTGSTLTGVDVSTGRELWTAPQSNHPEAADGVVVGTQLSPGSPGSLTAVDAAAGDTLWSAPGRSSYGDLLAIGDGVVVALDATSGDCVAYELASGEERWRASCSTGVQPQLIDGTSVVMLWEGDLAVISSTDGSTTWSTRQPLHSPLMSSVGSNGTTLFVTVNSLPWTD